MRSPITSFATRRRAPRSSFRSSLAESWPAFSTAIVRCSRASPAPIGRRSNASSAPLPNRCGDRAARASYAHCHPDKVRQRQQTDRNKDRLEAKVRGDRSTEQWSGEHPQERRARGESEDLGAPFERKEPANERVCGRQDAAQKQPHAEAQRDECGEIMREGLRNRKRGDADKRNQEHAAITGSVAAFAQERRRDQVGETRYRKRQTGRGGKPGHVAGERLHEERHDRLHAESDDLREQHDDKHWGQLRMHDDLAQRSQERDRPIAARLGTKTLADEEHADQRGRNREYRRREEDVTEIAQTIGEKPSKERPAKATDQLPGRHPAQ